MRIKRARIDLVDVHTTTDPLRGAAKDNSQPFAFLTAKAAYNKRYREAAAGGLVSIQTTPVAIAVRSVGGHPADAKSFWRGAANSAPARYAGHLGGRDFDVAWDRFLPFALRLPSVSVRLVGAATERWEPGALQAYVWPCGWATRLSMVVGGDFGLPEFRDLMLGLDARRVDITVGTDRTSTTLREATTFVARWIRDRVFEPVLRTPLDTIARYGPMTFVSVSRGSDGPSTAAQLDDASVRAIYAATTRDALWEKYNLKHIRAGFKNIDRYQGSFIFMHPMARFFWFPALMDAKNPSNRLRCYLDNTIAATMLTVTLAQFLRVIVERQTGATLKLNWPLRALAEGAIDILDHLRDAYPNTTLKRLNSELEVPKRLAAIRSLMPGASAPAVPQGRSS